MSGMTAAEFQARQAKENKSSQIKASNVSDTPADVADRIMFESASAVAKRLKNVRVDDYVHLKENLKVNKGEREGITITLPDGSEHRYLKI